ncbi:MAG: WD40 repeat domain-containing protein [Planctomycetes bacterium]|nr:WD40 repeat domain-containing protein [Planctomycetota bacterium]
MQSLLRFWPKLVAASFLVAVAAILYQIAPMEPRWRVTWVEKGMDAPEFYWDTQGPKVRLLWNPKKHFPPEPRLLARETVFDLKVLDLRDGREQGRHGCSTNGERQIWDLVYSEDGRNGIYRSGDIQDWWVDFATGKEKLLDPRLTGQDDLFARSFSPAGKYYFIFVWDWVAHEQRNSLLAFRNGTNELLLDRPIAADTFQAGFVREDQILFSAKGAESATIIWDLTLARETARFPFTARSFILSSDRNRIAFRVNTFPGWELWDISDLARPNRLRLMKGHLFYCGFSPDARIWSFWNDENILEIWDAESGKTLHELTLTGAGSWHHCFSPDSRRLGVISHDDGQRVFHFVDPWKGRILWEHPIDLGLNCIEQPLITADSRRVILSHDNAYHFLDAENGRTLAQFPNKWACGVRQLSADHRLLLIPHGIPDVEPDQSWITVVWEYFLPRVTYRRPVSVIDMETFETVFALDEHPVPCIYPSLSPDGNMLLVAGVSHEGECSLTCWDVPGRKPWRWIMGIPAALGLLLLLFGGLRGLMRYRLNRNAV